jgi:hypothetical protein
MTNWKDAVASFGEVETPFTRLTGWQTGTIVREYEINPRDSDPFTVETTVGEATDRDGAVIPGRNSLRLAINFVNESSAVIPCDWPSTSSMKALLRVFRQRQCRSFMTLKR